MVMWGAIMGWPRSAASTHSMHGGSTATTGTSASALTLATSGTSTGALAFWAGLGASVKFMVRHSLVDIIPALLMAQTLQR